MKLSAITPSYNDEAIIAGTIKCLKPFVSQHIVLISEEPYFGEYTPPDNTENIAQSLGCDVVKGFWELDNFQRNCGIALCQDADWIFTFDSDEMMTREELEKFIQFLRKTDAYAVCSRPEVYWKTTEYRLRPIPDYAPVLAVRPNVTFTHIRNVDSSFVLYTPGTMHHLSWCAPKDIYKKVTNYAHATDFDGEKWYKDKYEPWVPIIPAELSDGMFDVIKEPLPKELQEYL